MLGGTWSGMGGTSGSGGASCSLAGAKFAGFIPSPISPCGCAP